MHAQQTSPSKKIQVKIGETNKQPCTLFTLQEFGVYEQFQGQEKHHQDDTGHQDTVEASAEQTDLPQGHSATAARLQPVGPKESKPQKKRQGFFFYMQILISMGYSIAFLDYTIPTKYKGTTFHKSKLGSNP